MGLFQSIFRRKKLKLRYVQPNDQQMYQAAQASRISPRCDCLQLHEDHNGLKELRELHFHTEIQNKECDAWKLMETLVEKAIEEKSKEFSPGLEMPPEMWSQIITLPPSIARLKSVRKLYLYGSHLVRIPVEIGEMTDLEEFDAYTSYRLHWLPYEITRCQKLKRSRMSTRALYGNYKYRPPFPRLPAHCVKLDDPIGCCSVCGQKLLDDVAQQVWISLKVATDVLPLLVNACSEACIQRLPSPEKGYVNQPHKGGLELQQPSTRF